MFENYLQAFGAAKKNTKFENRSSISEINILEFNKKYVLHLKCSADSIDPICLFISLAIEQYFRTTGCLCLLIVPIAGRVCCFHAVSVFFIIRVHS